MIGLVRTWEVKRRVRRRVKREVKVRMIGLLVSRVLINVDLMNIISKCLDIKNFKLTNCNSPPI
jgi:hypothetical protein